MTALAVAELAESARRAARAGRCEEAEAYLWHAIVLDERAPDLWRILGEVTRDREVVRISKEREQLLRAERRNDAPSPAARIVPLAPGVREQSLLWRARLLAASLWLLVLLALWALGQGYARRYEGRFYPGVSIDGLDVGGWSPEQAERLFQARVQELLRTPLELRWGESRVVLSAAEAGLVIDLAQTFREALAQGREGGVWRRWLEPVRCGLWGHEVPLAARVDSVRLQGALDVLARQVERPGVAPAFAWDGARWTILPGQHGRRLDRNETGHRLEALLLSLARSHPAGALVVPVAAVTQSVALTPAEVASLGEQLELLGRPLFVRCGEVSRTVEPEVVGSWVRLVRDPSGAKLEVDPVAIQRFVEQVAAEVDRPARDGRLVVEGNRAVEFRLAQNGRALDRTGAEEILRETCARRLRGEPVDVVDLPVHVRAGHPDPLQLELGILERIGEGFSSFAGSSPERANNIWVGGRELNGRLIAPGEIFSLNGALAPISWEKGYRVAPIISEGVLVLGLGGGLCQVSTTVYRAALFSGLEIVERHPHQWRIPYYEQDSPPGFDATILQGGPDLKFRNNTEHYLLMEVETDLEEARQTVRFYGTSPGWKVTVGEPEISADGLTVVYRRTVEREGIVLSEETYYSFYAYHEW